MKIEKYTVAYESDRYALEDEVNKLIEKGWQPFGRVGEHKQAMVMYSDAHNSTQPQETTNDILYDKCPFPEGNKMCTNGKDTYHQFNRNRSCNFCGNTLAPIEKLREITDKWHKQALEKSELEEIELPKHTGEVEKKQWSPEDLKGLKESFEVKNETTGQIWGIKVYDGAPKQVTLIIGGGYPNTLSLENWNEIVRKMNDYYLKPHN